MRTHIFFFVLVLLVSFSLGYFAVHWGLSLVIILGLGIVYFYVLLSPVLFTKDISKTETFLQQKQKHPFYSLIYSMANHLDDEVNDAINKVLLKYKSPTKQALFKTMYALYTHDLEEANQHVKQIKPFNYKQYYQALICIAEDKIEEARSIANNLQPNWMKHTILAEVHLKEGHLEMARSDANKALDESRGIQKYSIYKNFETVLNGK